MTLPSSGEIKIKQIRDEFGGPTTTHLKDYYAGGSYVPAGTLNGSGVAIPSSGQIKLKDFYGASAAIKQWPNADSTGWVLWDSDNRGGVFTITGDYTAVESPSAYVHSGNPNHIIEASSEEVTADKTKSLTWNYNVEYHPDGIGSGNSLVRVYIQQKTTSNQWVSLVSDTDGSNGAHTQVFSPNTASNYNGIFRIAFQNLIDQNRNPGYNVWFGVKWKDVVLKYT